MIRRIAAAGPNLSSLDLDERSFVSRAGEVLKAHVEIAHTGADDGVRSLDCVRVGVETFFEGDIIVRPLAWPRRIVRTAQRAFGHGVTQTSSLWPGGKIPIAVNEALRALVDAAVVHWVTHTPIRFTSFAGETDFLAFEPADVNGSEVGRMRGMQRVLLRADTTAGTVVHEIGHALGLWHEHSRSDRNNHVQIHPENFDRKDAPQFEQPIRNAAALGPYDLSSIMHYPSLAFSNNNQPTITARNGQPIGQRDGLSAGDIAAMRRLYPQLDWTHRASVGMRPWIATDKL